MGIRVLKERLIDRETFFILLFVSLATAAFFPVVYNNAVWYGTVKYLIFVVLIYLATATRVVNALKSKIIIVSLVIVCFIFIQLLIFYSQNFNVRWSDLTCLLIVVLFMSVGYCSQIDERQTEIVVIVFAIFAAVAGLWSMFYYVGSLTLNDYLYAVDAKNQIGQFVASATTGIMILLFANKRFRFIKIGLLTLLVILLLVLRCRTALLAFLFFAVMYYYKTLKARDAVFLVLTLSILMILFYAPVLSFLEDVFVGNKDIDDLNSVSSNRLERNIDGFDFWFSNSIFGELQTPSGIARIHNYLINILVAYGLFSFPFIVLYFHLLVVAAKRWKKVNVLHIGSVGYWVMFIPFFCSLLEPSAPYGPGLVQAVPFFLFGNSMRPCNR